MEKKTVNFADTYGLNIIGSVESWFQTRKLPRPDPVIWQDQGRFNAQLNVLGKVISTNGHWNKKDAKNQLYSDAYDYICSIDEGLKRNMASSVSGGKVHLVKPDPEPESLSRSLNNLSVSGMNRPVDRLDQLERRFDTVASRTQDVITATNANIDATAKMVEKVNLLERKVANLAERLEKVESQNGSLVTFFNDLTREVATVRARARIDTPVVPVLQSTKVAVMDFCTGTLHMPIDLVPNVFRFVEPSDVEAYKRQRGLHTPVQNLNW